LRAFLRRIREYASEVSPRRHFTGGIAGRLATRNQFSEDVRILSIIETERKLRQIERQIRRTDFVEAPHHAALEQTPKVFEAICVNAAIHLFHSMVNNLMRIVALQSAIRSPFVGVERSASLYMLFDFGLHCFQSQIRYD